MRFQRIVPALVGWILLAHPAAAAAQSAGDGLLATLDSVLHLVRAVHPAPFRRVARSAFEAEAAALRADMATLSEERAVARMMHLVARLRDGHTTLLPGSAGGFDHWLPLRFYAFSDGVYLTAVDSTLRDLAGARVLRVGEMPALAALDSVGTLIGADNDLMRREVGALLLSSPAALHALGIAHDSQAVTFLLETRSQARRTVTVRALPGTADLTWRFWGEMFGPILDSRDRYGNRYISAIGGKRPLEYRTLDPAMPPHLRYRLYYYFAAVAPRTMYLQINFMADDPKESFIDFRRRLWAAVDSAGMDRLVLDLRYNSGGNGALNLPFVHDIIRHESIDRAGHLYVLVGRKTFSAAVMLAAELARQTDAAFVGEATGAGPNHAGDPTDFPLPHTGMRLSVSTLFWQLGHPADTLAFIPVSVAAPFSSTDYYALRDPALQAVLDGSARPLAQILQEDGADAARREYAARRARYAAFPWWQPFDQGRMNELGYELLRQGRSADAIAAFEMNTTEHPRAWGWWDSLGDGYRAAGLKDRARAAYGRALALNPEAEDTRAKANALP